MRKLRAAVTAALAAALLTGCGPAAPEPSSATIYAMDTVMELTVYGEEELLEEATDLIHDLESRLSVTKEGSDIYKANIEGSARLSEDAARLTGRALEICALTGGALDISVYPVVRAWGFTTGEYRVPGDDELRELLKTVDYSKISLQGSDLTLPEGYMVDLGSVAKGYTASAVIDLFRGAGVTSALVNLGGNVEALGSKPDGSPWRVGIRDPMGDGYFGVLEIRDAAVVTSGGYERYFEEDGVTYWHIIDPSTGRPAHSGLSSVTVTGPDGTLCDGLSTALFVMGLERAAQLWRDSGGFEAVFVTESGEVYITSGLEDAFTLEPGRGELKVIDRG